VELCATNDTVDDIIKTGVLYVCKLTIQVANGSKKFSSSF
jgi:hypothetical protein